MIARKKPAKEKPAAQNKSVKNKPAKKKTTKTTEKEAAGAIVPTSEYPIVPTSEYPIVLVEHDKQEGFYRKLRVRMRNWIKSKSGRAHKWAEVLMLAPDFFHLLCRLMVDKDVPVAEKVKLGMVIAYFISPLDLMPEAIFGPAGYLDDVALTVWVLHRMLNVVDPEVVRRNWAGEGDVLDVIKQVMKVADEMMGVGLWKRLKGIFK